MIGEILGRIDIGWTFVICIGMVCLTVLKCEAKIADKGEVDDLTYRP